MLDVFAIFFINYQTGSGISQLIDGVISCGHQWLVPVEPVILL